MVYAYLSHLHNEALTGTVSRNYVFSTFAILVENIFFIS